MADVCTITSRNGKNNCNQDDNYCVFNVISVFISLVTILADLTTDILVVVEYCKDGYMEWAFITFTFILSPNIVTNIFSLRWIFIDKLANVRLCISHGFLFGLLERYILFLYEVFSCKNFEVLKSQKLLAQRNDLSLLHFLYIFTGTVPQIILQSYSIIMMSENYYTKVFSLTASIASVIWGCVIYLYSISTISMDNVNWMSIVLKLTWYLSSLIGRISGIILFNLVFGVWTLIPLGLHWCAMSVWIMTQKTRFCSNKYEEMFYNVIMGFVYCFCFVNVKGGHTRYRLLLFYTLFITQNFGSLILYVLISDVQNLKKLWSIISTLSISFGTVFGIITMILYYRYFHPKGPIPWKYFHEDIDLNNDVQGNSNCKKAAEMENNLRNLRTFKTVDKDKNGINDVRKISSASQSVTQIETENTDKKFLLDHWIARAGSPTFTSAPVGNLSMDISSIEMYTVENTPQSVLGKRDPTIPPKLKKKICSPTELNLKLSSIDTIESSIDEITSNTLNIHKRRGICSSDDLRENLNDLGLNTSNYNLSIGKAKTDRSSELSHETDGSNKKTSSDSIDLDLDLSFSDINSSDINSFNENIVQKLCLSALKNIKVGNQDADIENIQRIALDILKEMYKKKDKLKNGIKSGVIQIKRDLDTPTEVLSVHDYENICAVNIAREAWGLRSWNGYCDIENWLHDGSVVRDRSRDTFTSESSDISSCLSQDLKNAILSAPPFPRKPHTYSNVFVKLDRGVEDYANTVMCQTNEPQFVAKPCIVENYKDPNHLEPILEELDDLGDIDPANKKRLNSESSLVATIDEIRKATVTNSPRQVYHRRENTWDSPNTYTENETSLKKALWKEPSKFDSSNIMGKALEEKEISLNISNPKHIDLSKGEINNAPVNRNITNTSNSSNFYKNSVKKHKPSHHFKTHTKMNNQTDHLNDLSNKDIDFLWQIVTENSLSFDTPESLSFHRKTPSLQSLIQKDDPPSSSNSKNSNIKKISRNRPRRKFSILREKFEPKINSDEETLYNKDSNTSRLHFNNIDMVKDKAENILPAYESALSECNVDVPVLLPDNSRLDTVSSTTKQIKEKRSLFMKQVLSPPKLTTKLRYKL
ncbi:unnamed protein product [Leptidea sinapis]|uniref:XK-related protein n=1 Tax=Leptidea sinapis TaxID=189913 RepID=A0A5E4QAJ4_9NEOP|nr:unnamed protein product [Leptidea sinapis]